MGCVEGSRRLVQGLVALLAAAVLTGASATAAAAGEPVSPTERVRREIAAGHVEAALALLPAADPNERDILGGTLLHAAANFSGDLRLIGALLKAGVPVDARDQDDQTALHVALRHAHGMGMLDGEGGRKLRAVAELLIAHGARLAPEPRPASPDAPRLLHALLLRQIEAPFLSWLIARGLPVPDDTALAAIQSADQPATVERALVLLRALPDASLQRLDGQGRGAAHHAAGDAIRLPLLKALAQRSLDLRAVDRQGVTVFADAAGSGHLPTLTWLAERRAVSMAADHDGFTPLHRAALDPRPETLQWLLQQGADLQARDRAGRRALDIAVDSRRFAYLQAPQRLALARLLGGGPADVTRGRIAQPPLYLAVTSPSRDVRAVERLLAEGADANVRNEDGHTPLQQVLQGISTLPNTPDMRAFCRQLLPLLLHHGADPRRIQDPWTGETHVDLARRLRVLDELQREMVRAAR